MKHSLADAYRAERNELLALGRTLTTEQAASVTTACPAWSVKDVYAHLAGIATNIVEGDTEGAATEAWADGHVRDRLERGMAEVLDEWQAAGDQVSDVMDEAGDFFPFQLFVDQWTHGWDIRATLGSAAAATPDLAVYELYLDEFFQGLQSNNVSGMPGLSLMVTYDSGHHAIVLGDAPPVGSLKLSLFEYARISMGRRSLGQLNALPWPQAITDPTPYIDQLVVWSVNEHDVIDPIA